ncbi:MAG TPA: 16S rRNA (cytosine(1402)-N(4))-methyltransferase RsmH [Acidimicrobiia bacterium]|nr:16S rRNA (cytosine(1402)-N(4))-methyltransferase RsmH [Acidimicrobiia bacterium]
MEEFSHLPVMAREVVELLSAVPGGLIVDCTVGGGGHSAVLLDARPDMHVLGLDRDADAVTAARSRLARFGDRVQVVHGGFEQLGRLVERHGQGEKAMGILMDLGVSSAQLDRPERGFSYRFDAPLDMRMDAKQTLTATEVVNTYEESQLAAVISQYGEERFARRIAHAIVAARPLRTTRELADVVRDAIPAATRRRGPHPARRTFQAIRMEVNRELPNLADGLDESVHVIGPRGRVLVLAYHSLEDRMVKQTFGRWAGDDAARDVPAKLPIAPPRANALVRVLTRKPMRPSVAEIAANPRAESARLRAVERLLPDIAAVPDIVA